MSDSNANRRLLTREDAALVVIDIQERLMPVIARRAEVEENARRLMEFARIIGMPVLITEQEKLGPTIPALKALAPDTTPITKQSFNSFFCEPFAQAVAQLGRRTLILAGVEAHVCVAQTVLSQLERGSAHVISDAVGSRTQANWEVAINRMREAGAVISSTEMIIFELLRKAGTDEFRAGSKLVK